MMGDNRHNSLDAKAWGFTPFNHVVGKPVFIWMSWDTNGKGLNKIRWERLFTTVNGSGQATSFFIPFLVLLIGFILFNKWWKKNKALDLSKNLTSDVVHASIQDRIKAAVIDSIIIIVALFMTSELFALFDSIPNYIKIVVSIIVFILYDPLLTSLKGGTIGHTLSKITVRKDEKLDENISFPRALIRFVLKALLGWISLITISGNEKKKAIHDYAANSVVIKR